MIPDILVLKDLFLGSASQDFRHSFSILESNYRSIQTQHLLHISNTETIIFLVFEKGQNFFMVFGDYLQILGVSEFGKKLHVHSPQKLRYVCVFLHLSEAPFLFQDQASLRNVPFSQKSRRYTNWVKVLFMVAFFRNKQIFGALGFGFGLFLFEFVFLHLDIEKVTVSLD